MLIENAPNQALFLLHEEKGLEACVSAWVRRFPEITREEALADLWHQGVRCNETLRAHDQRLLEAENDRMGVITDPRMLSGWHLVWAKEWKPGVLHGELSHSATYGSEIKRFFAHPDIIRVAREQRLLTSNGMTLPD